jgi:hypothetical protein
MLVDSVYVLSGIDLGAGIASWHSDGPKAARTRNRGRCPAGTRGFSLLRSVQFVSLAHPVTDLMVISRAMKFITHLHLVPGLMPGAVPPLPIHLNGMVLN